MALSCSVQGACGGFDWPNATSPDPDVANTDLYDTWEVGYSHYHYVAGVQLPNTHKLIVGRVRPDPCSFKYPGGISPGR
jgi:hypothetical protein